MNNISNPIRIAYVIGQLTLGGTESQLLELARHINPSIYKILIVCLSEQAPLASSFVEADCEVQILNREERGRLRTLWDLYRLFRLFKPDIVHSYAYASRAAIPISKIYSNSKNIVSIRTQPSWQFIWLDRLVNSFSDMILTNSRNAESSVGFGLLNSVPVRVIKNGIDLKLFDIVAGEDLKFSKPLGIKVICSVARLHPVKGLDLMLEAFAILGKSAGNVHLWIVGDGPEKTILEEQAVRLGISSKVVFWGEQENIPAILKFAHVGALSSLYEGLPNAVIEYMAARLPVVATDVGGVSELVIHNKNGLLVSPNNPEKLASSFLILLKDMRMARTFGENGRAFIEQFFTLERMIAETERIYEDIFLEQ